MKHTRNRLDKETDNTFSFERGPRGERGPRARQKGLQIEALLARARGPRTPFALRTPFKGNLVRYGKTNTYRNNDRSIGREIVGSIER